VITGIALSLSLSLSSTPAPPAPPAYREVLRTDVLVIAVAPRAGRAENVVRAVAVVAAPADAVWDVVTDLEGQKDVLPDTTVSDVLGTKDGVTFVHQRCETAFFAPREYVIATRTEVTTSTTGAVRRAFSWSASDAHGHVIDADAVYVTDNVGVVIVEAVDAARTRVTLQIAIDPAGAVPAFITNAAQTAGVEQALRVLERAAQERARSSAARVAQR
jgi:hypothetical protein